MPGAVSQTSYHIGISQGLKTNAITDITRDRNSNMWIGSYNGLYKHEGSNIKSFVSTGTGTSNISGLEMHSIYEDRLGFIWAGTTNGLDKINPHTYAVTHYPIRPKDSISSFVGYIYAVFQDDEDYMWVCTDAAMFRMDYKTGVYTEVPITKNQNGLPAYSVSYNSGIRTGKGIWMHTFDGMAYYEYTSKKFYHRYYNPDGNPIFEPFTPSGKRSGQSSMDVDAHNNIWFVAQTGLLASYNWQTNKLDTFRFQHPVNAWYCCYSVNVDDKNNVWIGFRHGGILLFNQEAKTFTPILYKDRNSLISSNYIYSFEKDYRGNIWVATDNGIDVINYYDRSVLTRQLSSSIDFTNLKHESGDMSFDGQNALYIPFYRFGFLKYNIEEDIADAYKASNQEGSQGATYIIPGSGANVWAAREKKLVQVNLQTQKITSANYSAYLPATVEKYRGDVIWHWQQSDSLLFVRKNTGLLLLITPDSVYEMKGYGFKKNIAVAPDKKNLWYLTYKLDLVKVSVPGHNSDTIRLQDKLKNTGFLFSNPRDMIDDGQSVWMTGQNGLLRYNYKTGQLYSYSVTEGLSHSFTYSLVIDEKQRIWVGSIGGVNVYDEKNNLFRPVISYPPGSYMDAFGNALRISEGRLAFQAGNKLFIIHPESYFNQEKQNDILLFQEMQVNGISIDMTNEELLSSLNHRQNQLMIRFGLLRFEPQLNTIYWYTLKENSEWIKHGENTDLIFNELQAGNYALRVKATDGSGILLAESRPLVFSISPPWWKTWWFRLLIIAFVGALIYYYFRNREKTIRAKANMKQQLTELESKALRSQMNPHFIFNSLNAIQELIVTKKVDEGYQYLSNFSKLLRMVLNNSEKNLIPLSLEIEMIKLQLSLESLRFKNTFTYSVELSDSIEPEMVNVPPLLLQPYVENAIWHGLRHKENNRNLWIRITETGQTLNIEIEDNGVGRKKSADIRQLKLGADQFESKGSDLSAQRIKLIREQYGQQAAIKITDLQNDQGEARGTLVHIILPANLK